MIEFQYKIWWGANQRDRKSKKWVAKNSADTTVVMIIHLFPKLYTVSYTMSYVNMAINGAVDHLHRVRWILPER
jgi:hypothetical protein